VQGVNISGRHYIAVTKGNRVCRKQIVEDRLAKCRSPSAAQLGRIGLGRREDLRKDAIGARVRNLLRCVDKKSGAIAVIGMGAPPVLAAASEKTGLSKDCSELHEIANCLY
jgi:hypothetical protein